jgi:hypothetical protein
MDKTRGRKPLNRTGFHVRVDPQTPLLLSKKAQNMGYTYGEGGATGELLDAIAEEKLVLVPQEKWEEIKKLVESFKDIQEFFAL